MSRYLLDTPAPVKPHDGPSTFPVVTEYIGIRPGYCGGHPHILGHRIKVKHVVVWHEPSTTTTAATSTRKSRKSVGSSKK